MATGLICSTPSKESHWPHCSIPMKKFEFTELRRLALIPIVKPEEKTSFESFAVDYYRDQGYVNGTGSQGIHPSHQNPSTSFAPLLYVSQETSNSSLLFDLFSIPETSQMIDQMIHCLELFADENHSGNHVDQAPRNCSEIIDFLPPLTSGDLVIATPILSSENSTNLVGILASIVSWETLLTDSLHDNYNFLCRIHSSSTSPKESFVVQKGKARAITGIKSHQAEQSDDHLLTSMQRSYTLSPQLVRSKSVYSITYYSSDDPPLPFLATIVCVSCVVIAMVVIGIFFSFNKLIESAASESCQLLDSKRTYVRFVSHEIR